MITPNFSITINKKGYKHPFQLRPFTSDILTYLQIFLLKEYKFSIHHPPKVIVDAGANIGLAAIYFANQYPTAKIIAIEPEQSNFVLLKKNLAAYSNIIPVQAALWHKNEEIYLTDPGLGKWGFMTASKDTLAHSSAKTRHTVLGVTIDKLMQTYELETIDILKMDIEGAEKEVFSDPSAWIEKVNTLIIELHEGMKAGCKHSFYQGAKGFDKQWKRGENIYLTKNNCVSK